MSSFTSPRITVVTPSYNQGKYLAATIESVLSQGYPNLEYIVIDGGSTDQSSEILREYSKYLSYWVSEKDGGQADALNKGFARATGDIFCYLNSDDLFLPGALAAVSRHFVDQARVEMISTWGCWQVGTEIDEILVGPPQTTLLTDWLYHEFSLRQASTFWTRSLHEKVGPFLTSHQFCMDKDFFVRCVFGRGAYVPGGDRPVAVFRIHGDCKTSKLTEVFQKEDWILRERYLQLEPYRTILAKESPEVRARELVSKGCEGKFAGRCALLARSACVSPKILLQRSFWGAVRRLARA